jgi:hypothetical protein
MRGVQFPDFGTAMNMGGLTGTAFTHFGSQFIGQGQNLVNTQVCCKVKIVLMPL